MSKEKVTNQNSAWSDKLEHLLKSVRHFGGEKSAKVALAFTLAMGGAALDGCSNEQPRAGGYQSDPSGEIIPPGANDTATNPGSTGDQSYASGEILPEIRDGLYQAVEAYIAIDTNDPTNIVQCDIVTDPEHNNRTIGIRLPNGDVYGEDLGIIPSFCRISIQDYVMNSYNMRTRTPLDAGTQIEIGGDLDDPSYTGYSIGGAIHIEVNNANNTITLIHAGCQRGGGGGIGTGYDRGFHGLYKIVYERYDDLK